MTIKRIALLPVLLLITGLIGTAMAQQSNIRAYMNYEKFYAPEQGNYIEANLAVKGSSLTFKKNDNNKFQSKLQVTMIFSRADTVVTFEKYNLFSPELEDTAQIDFNFLDQKRFGLDTGTYNFELRLNDEYANLKNDTAPLTYTTSIHLPFNKDQIEISSLQFIDSYKKTDQQNTFTKNGIEILPYMSNFFPNDVNTLSLYFEIYNTINKIGQDEGFLINYYLESYESSNILDNYAGFKRMKTKPVNVFLHKFDITNLPSGNYNMVVEIKNKKNKQLALKKKFFQRSKPQIKYNKDKLESVNISQSFAEKMSRDSLEKFIPTLEPIANNIELLFIRSDLSKKGLTELQKYFLNFWESEDPLNPEKAWKNYYQQVIEVEKFYSTSIKRGYETDRGRVYLQYGPPNTINERDHKPSSYPYEIWHYNQLTESQWNKKFVFYNPDLVTNDYVLIHSNAIGEEYNPTWKYKLNKRNSITNDRYNTENPDHWGSEAEELYNNPY